MKISYALNQKLKSNCWQANQILSRKFLNFHSTHKLSRISRFRRLIKGKSCLSQGFILALSLTSVFHEGSSFMAVGHNPTCVARWPLQLGVHMTRCKPLLVGSRGNAFGYSGYFTDPMFSNSLFMHHLVT